MKSEGNGSLPADRKKAKIRVFLVDDHPIIRKGMQFLLSVEPDMVVCGEADRGSLALQKVAALQPDVAMVDLELKESSGFELIKQIRDTCPKSRILVFTMHTGTFHVERALRAGAHGYLAKEESAEVAVDAIRRIMREPNYLSPKLAKRMMERMLAPGPLRTQSRAETLSDRELEVLQLLGRGLDSRQVAETLHLSIKTVSAHREHIKNKLGLRSAAELINYAHTWIQEEASGSEKPMM